MPRVRQQSRSLEKREDAYKYGPVHIKWRHTEHEHFGPFQDLIKTLNSSSDTLYDNRVADSKFWPRGF